MSKHNSRVSISNDRLVIVHGGDSVGHSSVLMILPQENLAIAIFVNSLTWVFPFLSMHLTGVLLDNTSRDYCAEALNFFKGIQGQAQAGIQGVIDARDKESSPLPLEEYAGTYSSDLFGEIEITAQDGQLVHRYGGSGNYDAKLEHWEHDTFVANYHDRHSEPEFVTFGCGDDGVVDALEVKSLELFVDTFRRV